MLLLALFASRFDIAWFPRQVSYWLETVAGIVLLLNLLWFAPLALREMKARRELAIRAFDARRQVEQLFKMTDMLQSAMDHNDANAVLRATAAQLLPGLGGTLHVFNNSRDRLDLSAAWNLPADASAPGTISPNNCWALKRGKPHLNLIGDGALCCEHHTVQTLALEIPMMARGEVYGLLTVHADGEDAQQHLDDVASLAGAVADAMSLALSNIALREKLRTQALRDPLTGLYNRRYMEDVLERFVGLAERNGGSVAAIMIDLDHFKRINDEHGHAMGDAILREAAATICGAIRPSDVACRYGGEELLVLLPDCTLMEAMAKAETLRARIESLSDIHEARISASFGVASLPETAAKVGGIIPGADAALYQAKQEGRNRVICASRRPEAESKPMLAAAE
jgi:diguanylate cyclase (GGDEF)-like protein